MDKLVLTGMQFFGHHGVFPEENKLGQRFLVDLELYFPLHSAGKSDSLEETVNYADVYETVRGITEDQTFQLIEALAEHIAIRVLQTYTIINEITVRVHKPHPPFKVFFEGVAIEIHRKRA